MQIQSRLAALWLLIAFSLLALIVWRTVGVPIEYDNLWFWLLLLWGAMLLGWGHQPLLKQFFPSTEDPRVKTEPALHLKDHEVMTGYYAVTTVFVALAAFFVAPSLFQVEGYEALFGIKSSHFWWAVIASGLLNVPIFYLFNKGMRYGDQSLASAAWGLNPIIALPISFIIFAFLGSDVISSPDISILGLVGILVVAGAIALNALTQKKTTPTEPPANDWFAKHPIFSAYLGIGIIAPVAVNFDKVAIDAGNPFLAGTVTFGIVTLCTLLWTYSTGGTRRIFYILRNYYRQFLILGVVHGSVGVAFNVSLLGHNINYYGGLKRATVVFGTVYGIWVLKEGRTAKNRLIRLLASFLVLAGVFLIIVKG